jgi:hypothetical protein
LDLSSLHEHFKGEHKYIAKKWARVALLHFSRTAPPFQLISLHASTYSTVLVLFFSFFLSKGNKAEFARKVDHSDSFYNLKKVLVDWSILFCISNDSSGRKLMLLRPLP